MNPPWLQRIPLWIRKRIEGREQVQRIIGNITWLSLDKILRLGVGLFVGVWVARYLGVERFGQLNFAQAFVVLFSPLALLGLDSIAVRDLVRDPGGAHTTLGTSFILRLGGSAIGLVVAVVAMFILRPDDRLMQWLVVIAGAAFLFQAFDVIDLWFQAQVQSKYVVYARNISFLCFAAAKIGMLVMQANLLAFALAALGEIVLASLGLIFFYRSQGNSIRCWNADGGRAKELLKESWPLFLAVISTAIYMRIDQVMLGSLLGDKQVGIYTVAIKMIEIWYFIPMTIVSSLYPALINAREHDEQFYQRRLQTLYDTMSVIACALAIVTSLLSKTIIGFLYGAEFAGAGPVLSIYAWASIPVFLGVAANQNLVIQNRTRMTLYRTVTGGVVNVALNMFLIPRYGANGAAIASLISYTAATFFFGFQTEGLRQMGMLFRSLNPARWIGIMQDLRRVS